MTAEACEYTGRVCEFWEPGEPGECLAVDPEQCPANTIADVAAIRIWQERQENERVNQGGGSVPSRQHQL